MKMFKKRVLGIALAAAGLGLTASMPASAGLLTMRITDASVGVVFTCADNAACDTNINPNQISIDDNALNAALGASLFRANNIGASSNFAVNNPFNALITSSGSVTYNANGAGSANPFVIEISQNGWLLPNGNPRTLFQSDSATFGNSGAGDSISYTAFNDALNGLFTGNNVSPAVVFNASALDPECTGVAGILESCSGNSLLAGISEGNPFSLSELVVINLGPTLAAGAQFNRVDYTNSTSKFAANVVSEPGSMLLLSFGLFGLGVARRRKS
jgi:hypothetical protein